MSQAFEYRLDGDRLVLAGRVDENADLTRVASPLLPQVRVIDLGGVLRINSIGVREWMDFAAGFAGRELHLVRCAPAFVDQMNAIVNFTGEASVDSVLSAYECDLDGELVLVEVQTSDARTGRLPEPPPCARCGAATVPAIEDAMYYRFLRYAR